MKLTPEEEIKLRYQLDNLHTWPSEYMFKFIVPDDDEKRHQIEQLFGEKADIRSRLSSKGTYSAYSIVMVAESTDEVVNIYRKAGEIEGLRSL